jgi:ubiquinone biosynthesis protein UbiJ
LQFTEAISFNFKESNTVVTSVNTLAIGALETALNQYLSLDKHLDSLLAPLAGKVIAIKITPGPHIIYCCPTPKSIQLLETYHGEINATLSGSLSALGLMGLSATPMHALFKGEVRIEGDMELARKLQNLFAKLDIDLESNLAVYSGETFAKRLFKLVNSSRHWGQQSLNTFRDNLQEFLQEETRDLPAQAEAELLFQQIDACRSDFDRLQARFHRLDLALNAREPQNPPGSQP